MGPPIITMPETSLKSGKIGLFSLAMFITSYDMPKSSGLSKCAPVSPTGRVEESAHAIASCHYFYIICVNDARDSALCLHTFAIDAVHMPGKPSVMSDSGNILMTMTNTQEPQNANAFRRSCGGEAAAGLKLYDTASHAVSSFTPIKPGQVGIYIVWRHRAKLTAYRPHPRRRRVRRGAPLVRATGLQCDVRAQCHRHRRQDPRQGRRRQQWWERAYIYEREFTEAYSKLGVEPPTYEPRATGHDRHDRPHQEDHRQRPRLCGA